MSLPRKVNDLSEVLSSLPGIGPKLSNRLALYLSVSGKDRAQMLSQILDQVITDITQCEICGNVTETTICEICSDELRDKSIIIVVEDALDLYSIETTHTYKGLYHVLGGVISPINGIGPEELNINSLVARIKDAKISEVVIATNPNVEGDSTAMYIKNEINKINSDLKISRLAKGIPVGSDLEFVSGQTIIDSFKRRDSL